MTSASDRILLSLQHECRSLTLAEHERLLCELLRALSGLLARYHDVDGAELLSRAAFAETLVEIESLPEAGGR
jgi:hypothetical protein